MSPIVLDRQDPAERNAQPLLDDSIQLAGAVRRVGERHVICSRIEIFYERDRVTLEDPGLLAQSESGYVRLESVKTGWAVFHEVDSGCPPRHRLEP